MTNTLTDNLSWVLAVFCFSMFSFEVLIPACAAPSVIFILLLPLLPESPLWYTKKGREDKAKATLVLLRGKDYPVEAELKELVHFASDDTEGTVTMKDKMQYLSSRGVLLPTIMVSAIFFLQVNLSHV